MELTCHDNVMDEMKLIVSFPGGAGGNWLSNLVFCLKQDHDQNREMINYHSSAKGISITHNVTDKNFVFLNGYGLFNIYLNVIVKLRLVRWNVDPDPISRQFEILASEASSKLYFLNERIDLNWDNLLLKPHLFEEELFSILDSYNVIYTKNSNRCQTAINNYLTTCINPKDYYNNWDNIYWLGWCHGISKHLWGIFPIVNSIEEMQDLLYPNKDYYTEFTSQYMIDINK